MQGKLGEPSASAEPLGEFVKVFLSAILAFGVIQFSNSRVEGNRQVRLLEMLKQECAGNLSLLEDNRKQIILARAGDYKVDDQPPYVMTLCRVGTLEEGIFVLLDRIKGGQETIDEMLELSREVAYINTQVVFRNAERSTRNPGMLRKIDIFLDSKFEGAEGKYRNLLAKLNAPEKTTLVRRLGIGTAVDGAEAVPIFLFALALVMGVGAPLVQTVHRRARQMLVADLGEKANGVVGLGDSIASWLGHLERVLYIALLMGNAPIAILGWIGVRTAGNWKRWKEADTRAYYELYLFGQLLSVVTSLGALVLASLVLSR